jgi:hypothetical protein
MSLKVVAQGREVSSGNAETVNLTTHKNKSECLLKSAHVGTCVNRV